jgi:putative transcriptional regulator
MNIKEMREYLGEGKPLPKAVFSRIYKIPVRTLEDWEAEKRVPPEYVLYLLERAVIADKGEIMNNKFKLVRCANGIELGMPEKYLLKLREYCCEKGITVSNYLQVILEESDFIMSDFYLKMESDIFNRD